MGVLRRHGLVSRPGALFLALFTATAVASVVKGTAWFDPGHTIAVGVTLCVGTFIMAAVLLPSVGDRYVLRVLAFLVTAALQFAAPTALWSAVLAARGERTLATVAEVETGPQQRVPHVYYHLVDGAGRPVHGRLEHRLGYEGAAVVPVGGRFAVVHDPAGLVGPQTPEVAANARCLTSWAVPALYLALVVVCAFLGRPPARPGPEPAGAPGAAAPAAPAAQDRPVTPRRRLGRQRRRRRS